MPSADSIAFVDSHTEGEPTRTVLSGAPALAGRSVAEMAADFAAHHDWFRAACIDEPRGNDVLVGALLVPSPDPACDVGVIYFNNAGVLGMCGHGTIGVVRTLVHLGRLAADAPRAVRLDTPVGTVTARIGRAEGGGLAVDVGNVASRRVRADLALDLGGGRRVTGDVAWGGNGFFLCHDHGERIELANRDALTGLGLRIRAALDRLGPEATGGIRVDHVELVGPPQDPRNHARNFVLCPGGAYDRSPCGTGTSAKLACLAARGALAPGAVWRQESVVGSVFEAWYAPGADGAILPTVRGRAWITAEGTLSLDPSDPFRHGIPSAPQPTAARP